jgi:hypothetical protein
MKTAQEIAYGFIIFFIIDRLARLVSAQLALKRNMSDLETERLRCTIELGALFLAFVFFKKCE